MHDQRFSWGAHHHRRWPWFLDIGPLRSAPASTPVHASPAEQLLQEGDSLEYMAKRPWTQSSGSQQASSGQRRKKPRTQLSTSSRRGRGPTSTAPQQNPALEKLIGANSRDARRQASANTDWSSRKYLRIKPPGSGKQEVMMPYGIVTLSKKHQDPGFMVTTQKKNYGGKSVGHTYQAIYKGLKEGAPSATDSQIAKDLLRGMKRKDKYTFNVIRSGLARNAAAKLVAITHGAEPRRVAGMDKPLRGLLRKVKRNEATLEDVLVGKPESRIPPLYTMAAKKGTGITRTMLRGKGRKNVITGMNIGYMSDSSGEEELAK